MEVYYADGSVHAVDEAKTAVEVNVTGWDSTESAPAFSSAVDASIVGQVRELSVPRAFVAVTDLETDETVTVGSDRDARSFSDSSYELRVETPLKLFIRVEDPFSLSLSDYDRITVSFPERTTVGVGFRSSSESPPETVVVPETPEGVAAAIESFSMAHRSTTADRSFHSMRTHPPLVEFGEELSIPDAVMDARPDTGVQLSLPPDLGSLLVAAPLAYYLGADLETEPGTSPQLKAAGESIRLGTGRAFEQAVASLLRRCFWLDCLVRSAGPHGDVLQETALLEELAIEATDLYAAGVDERVLAYHVADFERIADRLPKWHLSLYPEPSYENVQCLPYVVANVPQVFSPRPDTLSGPDRLDSSLSDFYRYEIGSISTVELQTAELGESHYHGWLADGVVLDTFKAILAAYENRARFRDRADEPISIVSVLNEGEMSDEHAQAADIYRRRAKQLDIDVDVRESLTTAELARTIESRTDLLHFIGHCEESGLRCPDGNLSISSVSTSRAQTFFLNACGSYEEGLEMVRKGSVAGAVTFEKVLDSHAAKVGTAFARLVAHGYSIERALSLSRRRVIMGKDYAVVGDGTHVLTQTESVVGPEVSLTRESEDKFSLTYQMPTPNQIGSKMAVYLEESDKPSLNGSTQEFTLDRTELVRFLRSGGFVVIYQKDIHWPTELADQLEN
jgi:hypothetical protein